MNVYSFERCTKCVILYEHLYLYAEIIIRGNTVITKLTINISLTKNSTFNVL